MSVLINDYYYYYYYFISVFKFTFYEYLKNILLLLLLF